MARTLRPEEAQDVRRLVDPRQHFLGLVKGGALFVYCRQCQQFVRIDQSSGNAPVSPAPIAGLGQGA